MARQTYAENGFEAPEQRTKSGATDRSFRKRPASMSMSTGVVAALFVLAIASPAHAYLDPGTGSTILQLLLGGVAGAMVVLNLYWARVKAFFGISSDSSASEASPESSETPEPR